MMRETQSCGNCAYSETAQEGLLICTKDKAFKIPLSGMLCTRWKNSNNINNMEFMGSVDGLYAGYIEYYAGISKATGNKMIYAIKYIDGSSTLLAVTCDHRFKLEEDEVILAQDISFYVRNEAVKAFSIDGGYDTVHLADDIDGHIVTVVKMKLKTIGPWLDVV